MPRYFNVAQAKADGRTDEEIRAIMEKLGLEPLPQKSSETKKTSGMSVDTAFEKKEEPKEEKGFLRRVGENIWETAAGLPKTVLALGEAGIDRYRISRKEKELAELRKQPLTEERIAKEEAIAKEMEEISKINPALMKQEMVEQVSGDVGKGALYGAKKGAGTASFLVPGGGGAATSVGGRILTAGLRGMGAGALAGFSQDQDELSLDESLKDAVTGGLVGGATGAVFQGGGELFKGTKRLLGKGGELAAKGGEKLEKSARAKAIGLNPVKKYGGVKLFDKMDDAGIVGNSAEEIADSAGKILKQNSNDLVKGIKNAAGGELEVTTKGVIKKLTEALDDAPAAKKKIYERILKEVKEDFNNKGTMKLTDFFKLKQKYGSMGKWTLGSFFDDTTAGIYEGVYVQMNDIIDEALKATGNEAFRQQNKIISTAITALRYADDASMKVANQGIGLYEIIAGAAGFAGGGGVGSLTAIAGAKALKHPLLQKAFSKYVLQEGGKKVAEMAGRESVRKLPQMSTAPVIATSMAMEGSKPQAQPELDTSSDNMFREPTEEAKPITGHTVDEYLSAISQAERKGDKKASAYFRKQMEIESEYEERNAPEKKLKLTDKQRSYAGAGRIGQQIIDIMEESPSKTMVGPLGGRVSKVGEFLGTESKEQTQVKSKIASARTAARNALLGANMSDKEIESYLDATFDINLPRKVLLNRLRTFVEDMDTLSMTDTEEPTGTYFNNGSSAF